MGDSWVIPRNVDKMVWILVSASYYKAEQGNTEWENDSWVIPTTRQGRITIDEYLGAISSNPTLPSSRNHPSFSFHPILTINLESGTHDKLATFLGRTHGWFLGDSLCDIINGA